MILTETEKAYIAGVFDGEGNVSVCKNKPNPPRWKNPQYQLVAAIANSNRSLLDFVSSKFSGTGSKSGPYGPYPSNKANGKPMYYLRFSGKQCKLFLRVILPYLHLKREQAKLALRYPLLSSRTHTDHGITSDQLVEREELFREMKRLNQKGNSVKLKNISERIIIFA